MSTWRVCRKCGCVQRDGTTCAEARREAQRGHRRFRRMLAKHEVPMILDDGRFVFAGKRYPGLNHGRPMESKKAFEKELADKGLVHSSPREMRQGPAKNNEARLAEYIQESYDVPASEARQHARDALAMKG